MDELTSQSIAESHCPHNVTFQAMVRHSTDTGLGMPGLYAELERRTMLLLLLLLLRALVMLREHEG